MDAYTVCVQPSEEPVEDMMWPKASLCTGKAGQYDTSLHFLGCVFAFQSKNVFLVSMFQHSCINKATSKCKFSPNSFYVNLAIKTFYVGEMFGTYVRVQEVPVVLVNAFVANHH